MVNMIYVIPYVLWKLDSTLFTTLHLLLVDCKWGEWSESSSCTKSCGGGKQTWQREVVQLSKFGGAQCKGSDNEMRDCNESPCPGIQVIVKTI